MNPSDWTFPRPFPSHRGPVMAPNGVVATAHPLASAAGLDVQRRGGNFMDSALAAAAVLNVVEPYNSNLGGDVFMIVHEAARVRRAERERHRSRYGDTGSVPGRYPD